MPSEVKNKRKAKADHSKRLRRGNGRAKSGSPRPKLSNARLRKLAAKNRPPQRWHEDEQDLF